MRRAVVVTLVVVIVALGVGVGIDRLVLARTERRVVEDLASAGLTLSQDAEVRIGGFPFLTQVWRGQVATATLEAETATVESLDLTDVEVIAEGISTGLPATVEHLAVTATAPEKTLTQAVTRSPLAERGFDVTITIDDGRVRAQTAVLGLPVEVGMVPEPAGREIAMGLDSFAIAGFAVDATDLPGPLRDALARITVPLDGIPVGLAVTAVDVRPEGLRLGLEGDDVVLDDLQG